MMTLRGVPDRQDVSSRMERSTFRPCKLSNSLMHGKAPKEYLSLWSVIALGIGSMVGAGIFALMGQATLMAGKNVYWSFLLGGVAALLSGYTYAKLGSRYPGSGGIMDYFNEAFSHKTLSGALTLAIMILPLIMRTTEEALLSVPDMYREGSFGLGAGRLRTVTHIVLPTAIPGILSGIILAIGRIVGETAALMYTSGTVEKVAGLMDSGSTLALHMYKQASEGLYTEQAYATSVILLALVLLINFCSSRIAKLMMKGRE